MQKKEHDERKTKDKKIFKCEKNFIIQLLRQFH